MLELSILYPSILNGLTTGAVYALIALGLTLIYGVLHIINFAHGAALMVALYGVYFLHQRAGIDPYLALPIMVPAMFAFGYALQRFVIGRASHGKDENILLVTLGISIILENLALYAFKSDTRNIDTPYTLSTLDIGGALISVPKVVAFGGALATAAILLLIIGRTDLGRAIRACAKERQGARLALMHLELIEVGLQVHHLGFKLFLMIGNNRQKSLQLRPGVARAVVHVDDVLGLGQAQAQTFGAQREFQAGAIAPAINPAAPPGA